MLFFTLQFAFSLFILNVPICYTLYMYNANLLVITICISQYVALSNYSQVVQKLLYKSNSLRFLLHLTTSKTTLRIFTSGYLCIFPSLHSLYSRLIVPLSRATSSFFSHTEKRQRHKFSRESVNLTHPLQT